MIIARYIAIQLVLDHGCPEPVTVGVIAYVGEHAELRLIGLRENSGKFSRGMYRHALPDLAEAGWIYEQWIDRLQRVAARFASRPEESLATLLRPESRGESIIASATGETRIQSIDGLPEIANSLFNELVLAKPAMRRAAFLGDVDNLLVDSELRWFDGYREDAEVEFLNDDGYPVQILYFPHLWDSKILNRRLVVKVLWFGGSAQEISASVADAANAFEVGMRREFVGPSGCIVLHSTPTSDQDRYLNVFRRSATTINIESLSAADDLRLVFFNG